VNYAADVSFINLCYSLQIVDDESLRYTGAIVAAATAALATSYYSVGAPQLPSAHAQQAYKQATAAAAVPPQQVYIVCSFSHSMLDIFNSFEFMKDSIA
jgi:hypothetical protein